MADWIGWLATLIVVCSYAFKRTTVLRRVQGVGAFAWIAYGVSIHSYQVIVANIFVAAAALWSSFGTSRKDPVAG